MLKTVYALGNTGDVSVSVLDLWEGKERCTVFLSHPGMIQLRYWPIRARPLGVVSPSLSTMSTSAPAAIWKTRVFSGRGVLSSPIRSGLEVFQSTSITIRHGSCSWSMEALTEPKMILRVSEPNGMLWTCRMGFMECMGDMGWGLLWKSTMKECGYAEKWVASGVKSYDRAPCSTWTIMGDGSFRASRRVPTKCPSVRNRIWKCT